MNFKSLIKSPSFFGFGFIFVFSAFLLLYYFYFIKKVNYFYLDNPTKEIVKVKIDLNSFEVNPDSFEKIKLEKGKHKIIIEQNNKPLKDTFFVVNDVNGVVNPTFSDYYILKNIYGYREDKDSIIKAQKVIKINNQKYRGHISHSKNIVISDFDFGLDESFPKIVHEDSINDRTKIFRKTDFIKEFESLKLK